MIEIESVKKAVEEAVNEVDGFVVSVSLVNDDKIDVFIDTDEGIMLSEIVKVSRYLNDNYPDITEMFSIEISSPGIGKPLKVHRQYVKNIGRLLKVTLADGVLVTGKLTKVSNTGIELEVKEQPSRKGIKSSKSIKKQISFTEIKEAVISIKFKN